MAAGLSWQQGYIAVDWGTTNRRAYRIDEVGKCVDEFEDSKGVLAISPGGFPDAVGEVRARLGDLPLLLAGMIGSNRGWVEAPYVACPVGIDQLAAALVWPGEREAIVPGASYVDDRRGDVMRGEEVQLLGAAVTGQIGPDALVCHPGTHNKWIMMHGGQLQSFRTVMTGELFSLLKDHSILSDLLQADVAADDQFRAAARHAIRNESFPADLFSVRANALLGRTDKKDAASIISGLLIGTDVRVGLSNPAAAVIVVMGRPELTALYAAAIEEAGRKTIELDGERCFLAGIHEIARRI